MAANPFPTYTDRKPLYKSMAVISQYVSMRDGVRLAVDVYLPKGLPAGARLPTILIQSRYWRAIEPIPVLNWFIDDLQDYQPVYGGHKSFLVSHGYAMVFVDVRGTGASFGELRYPWDPRCILDACDLLDWIVTQPWCSGRVAGMGVSYLGTTAELLLATRHPAVKAVIPMYNHPDSYIDIAFPGGLFNQRFVRDWSEMNESLDRNQMDKKMGLMVRAVVRGVRPATGERELLAEALKEHAANGNAYLIANDATYRDEIEPEVDASVGQLAIHNYRQAIIESQTPTYGWASWLDAGTADAALRRFLTYPGADQVTIGAWNHGGTLQASPYLPASAPISPPAKTQFREMLRFLDTYLLDIETEIKGERRVNYYTLGSETWQTSPTWPPAGVGMQRWFLNDNQALSREPPIADQGEDFYKVDFQVSTGPLNRWWELSVMLNQTVQYPDREAQASRLLFYQTSPFEQSVEILGNPVIRLALTCSVPDCAFIAYLEDVAPDGKVYHLTEGELRAIHRKVSPNPPYNQLVPYHSFKESDVQPLIPGEPAEITFGLLAVAARVQAGHRLRLSLAGHDEGTFLRVPETGIPEWHVLRNTIHASWIDILIRPVMT